MMYFPALIRNVIYWDECWYIALELKFIWIANSTHNSMDNLRKAE